MTRWMLIFGLVIVGCNKHSSPTERVKASASTPEREEASASTPVKAAPIDLCGQPGWELACVLGQPVAKSIPCAENLRPLTGTKDGAFVGFACRNAEEPGPIVHQKATRLTILDEKPDGVVAGVDFNRRDIPDEMLTPLDNCDQYNQSEFESDYKCGDVYVDLFYSPDLKYWVVSVGSRAWIVSRAVGRQIERP